MRTRQGRMRRQVARLVSRTALGLVTAVAALALVVAGRRRDPGKRCRRRDQSGLDRPPAAIRRHWAPGTATCMPSGTGFGQNFASGAIFFSPDTGAKIMFGAILDKYRALGGPADSDLGFPNIDEGPGKVSPDSRNSTFSAGDNPVIFWTPDTGAWVVRGAINAAWDRLGGSAGALGVPVADETYDGDVVTQKFTGGQLSFDSRTKIVHHRAAGPCGPTRRTEHSRSTRRRRSTPPTARPAAPPGRWVPGRATSSPIGPDGVGQEFAGGKVFYSPATGAHAVTGAILDEVRVRGRPDRRSRVCPTQPRPTAECPTAGSVPLPRRTIRSSSGRPTTARSSSAAR